MTVNVTTNPPAVVNVSTGTPSTSSPGVVQVNPSDLADQVEPYTFTFQGPLSIYTGTGRLYLDFPCRIETVRFSVGDTSTAPTVLDLKVNGGSSVFSSAPSLPAGENSIYLSTGFSVPSFVRGDFLTVDILSVGLSQPAANLTVTIRVRRMS